MDFFRWEVDPQRLWPPLQLIFEVSEIYPDTVFLLRIEFFLINPQATQLKLGVLVIFHLVETVSDVRIALLHHLVLDGDQRFSAARLKLPKRIIAVRAFELASLCPFV